MEKKFKTFVCSLPLPLSLSFSLLHTHTHFLSASPPLSLSPPLTLFLSPSLSPISLTCSHLPPLILAPDPSLTLSHTCLPHLPLLSLSLSFFPLPPWSKLSGNHNHEAGINLLTSFLYVLSLYSFRVFATFSHRIFFTPSFSKPCSTFNNTICPGSIKVLQHLPVINCIVPFV